MKPFHAKMIVITVIWTVLAFLSIMALFKGSSMNLEDWALVVLTLAPLGMGIPITVIVMDAKMEDSSSSHQDWGQNTEKAKRAAGDNSRLSMLMEMMDEDEREAFKETLKERVLRDFQQDRINEDGELPTSLAALMEEEVGRQRYRS